MIRKIVFSLVIVFVLACIFAFSACQNSEEKKTEESGDAVKSEFLVAEKVKIEDTINGYDIYYAFPMIPDTVKNADNIRENLSVYELDSNARNSLMSNPESSLKYDYKLSKKKGYCQLVLLYEENGEIYNVVPFYYDENKGKEINQVEFLKGINISLKDILDAFKKEYEDEFNDVCYGTGSLLFWFENEDKLCFSPYLIEQIDCDDSEHFLYIDNIPVVLGSNIEALGIKLGKPDKTNNEFIAELSGGTELINDFYDGISITSFIHPETGIKTVILISAEETGEKDDGKNNKDSKHKIQTKRGVSIGDSKDSVLSLYPEIDLNEQELFQYNSDVLSFPSPDGYITLDFEFIDDKVVKISSYVNFD